MKKHCIDKRSFYTLPPVWEQIINNYIHERSALGFYECSICLMFHTTSKYDNRTRKLRKQCSMAFLKKWFPQRKSKEVLVTERMERMIRLLNSKAKKNPVAKERARTEKRKRKELWKKNGWTKKNSILPLEEQKRLLSKTVV